MQRFEVHSHTHYSNFRLLDCINRPKELVNRAISLGLCGIAITDHETLAGHIELNQLQKEIQKEHPDFKIALGNEIYLTGTRYSNQKYYHFILIAKNETGHRALRELSSRAWMNSYHDRGMERVVTIYDDIKEIVEKYPNSLIATTACLGGELSTQTLNLIKAEKIGDEAAAAQAHNHIVVFMMWCKKMFGDDFYIECAPGCSAEQIAVNKRLLSIAKAFEISVVIGSDAHYLKKEDRFVHKAYLNSKGGEREVDDFYEYSYLQEEDELMEHLKKSFEVEDILDMYHNSIEIYNKIENYSLEHKQTIPKVEVKNYKPKNSTWISPLEFPILYDMFNSEDEVERYWVNECFNKLQELNKFNDIYLNRLEEEADIKKTISEKLGTNMFAYPVTLQHYVDMFWDCGSIVGAGRGSSCSGLNHYLLGITQLDPIKWELPFWRYLNKERVELGDIDLDLCPSKRPLIIQKIKAERGRNFSPDIDMLSRQNLGCTLIATYGTEGTRSTILTACRGYRSEDYPDGIDVDTAQYMSSLVPSERGFLWPLKDVVNGNPDKDRKPSRPFINEVSQYPGLLDIMMAIEGLVNKRSSHASGVILFDEDPYEFGCFMKTPKGEIITQYDLHKAEAAGMTKYDFLVTEFQDKLAEAIRLIQKDGEIPQSLSLREVYDKYFHPSVLPINDMNIWKKLHTNSVLNIFQFDSNVGSQAAKKIKPVSMLEMADANGLMRLMTSEKGEETPMEKYVRYKNDINLWYEEMRKAGLTIEEMKALEPHFLKSYGVPPSQEQLMTMLMDKNLCDFTLAEANAARKIVGKKQMAKIPELREKVLNQAKSPQLGQYIWKYGVGPQMGYAFSIIHALAYSFIGFQAMFIASKWNPIYWNTACLIVNSGSLEDNSTEELVDIYADEYQDLKEGVQFIDLPDKSAKVKRTVSTDYAKMAKAIGDIISADIKVSLVDINKSGFSFEPDVVNNQILFGMKALNGIGDPIIEKIIGGRPYTSFIDFMNRCPLNKTAMISLIKSGAFDNLGVELGQQLGVHPRQAIMGYYIAKASEPKSKLTLQNFSTLMKKDLIPASLNLQKYIYNFNKGLKGYKKGNYYLLNNEYQEFYEKYFDLDYLEVIEGQVCILQKTWDKLYTSEMDAVRDWLKENQSQVLMELNMMLFNETWNKYAKGSLSAWEMESLCFYYHEHELAHVNKNKYGIVDFDTLPTTPIVEKFFVRNGRQIPIYETYKIIGTVISKDDAHSSISLLTTTGVVNVKFTKEYFAMFGRQISEKQEDGTKKVMEKGWFQRGVKVLCTGYRLDDMFITKSYKHTPTHQLYKITEVTPQGDISLQHERYSQGDE